jgi:hypothetical protein
VGPEEGGDHVTESAEDVAPWLAGEAGALGTENTDAAATEVGKIETITALDTSTERNRRAFFTT